MANNRLYIIDRETKEIFFIAKSHGDGWWVAVGEDAEDFVKQLDDWLGKHMRDSGASYGMGDNRTCLELVDENHMGPVEEKPGPPLPRPFQTP